MEWLKSETQGPINVKFSSLLDGLMTVRAYGREEHFMKENYKDNDNLSHVELSSIGINRFICQINDMIGFFVIFINTFAVVFMKYYTDWIDEKFLAITIVTSTNLALGVSFISITYMTMESIMKLVKKAMEYTELPIEPELELEDDPQDWPQKGTIDFEDVSMSYKGALKPSLMNLNLSVADKEKVGIKGRTGSGKSSIINTLFRLYEIDSGVISIDGVDISSIGVHSLRDSISYIPQVPFIMGGTVKENLDPFHIFSDKEIQNALEEVKLDEYVNSLKEGLDTKVSQNNMVFSSGQKQLICLARSILENKKILCLDEATANVDFETDQIIQETIKRKFKD